MTDTMRFDNRVAIVTGSGGGIGRGYAKMLAERGARVVVNDLGLRGQDYAAARTVAMIEEAGGVAVADTNSVAEEAGAAAIVQTALDAFGRVDILINNAGVGVKGAFDEVPVEDFMSTINTHLMGQIWCSRAAWPHMRDARYGRIVQVSSSALFGMSGLWPYAVAKAGTLGLTRSLALEGAQYGIKCNAVTPFSASPGHDTFASKDPHFAKIWNDNYPPHLAAAGVTYLVHEDCALNGQCMLSGGGRIALVFSAETRGFIDKAMTPEKVRDNLSAAMDQTDFQNLGSALEAGAFQAYRLGIVDHFTPGEGLTWSENPADRG